MCVNAPTAYYQEGEDYEKDMEYSVLINGHTEDKSAAADINGIKKILADSASIYYKC